MMRLRVRRASLVVAALLVGLFAAGALALYGGRDERGSVARLTADAYYYHAYLVSFFGDGDLDFRDEYRISGNAFRLPATPIGRPGNVFPVGAPIAAAPFYVAGVALDGGIAPEAKEGFAGRPLAVTLLASVAYSVGALFFMMRLIRRRLRSLPIAAVAAVAAALAGPVVYYAVRQPGYAHPFATFFAAWLIDAWDASYERERTWRTWAGLGALLAATALARTQLATWGILLLFAAVDDWRRAEVAARRRLVARWGAGAAAAAVVFLPQLLAWKAVYGSFVVLPQGEGFMVWAAPRWVDVLFSSRGGLFAWAPLLAVGAVGLVVALARWPRLAGALLVGVALQVYVNAASWDWWGGAAFGGRRFDSCVPAFALGLGVLLAAPRVIAGAVAALALVAAWANTALAMKSGILTTFGFRGAPVGELVTPRIGGVLGGFVGGFSRVVTFPARAAFALRHGTGLDGYDRVVGVHLLTEVFPKVMGGQERLRETLPLGGREPFLVGFEPAGAGARLRGGRGAALIAVNRRHGPIRVRLVVDAPERVALTWRGERLATTVGAGGGVEAELWRIERGVHELGIEAPAGTVAQRLELEMDAGTPP